MTWPNDRKFTDANGQILNHWMGQLDKLKPLLDYSTQDFIDLKALIIASRQDEETDPGAVINLAFPIDTEPLPSEDWLLSYKNSANAGRRVPMSAFDRKTALLSTNALSGASTDIPIPTGYVHVELLAMGISSSAGGVKVQFSEDSGGTFVTQFMSIFNAANTTSSGDWFDAESVGTGFARYGAMMIYDYTSLTNKVVKENATTTQSASWVGGRILTSTAPINMVRYSNSAGVFDAGEVQVWGVI